MIEGMVRKWVRTFKDCRKNVHVVERREKPSAITENLSRKVDGKVRVNRCFTISSLSSDYYLFLNLKYASRWSAPVDDDDLQMAC
ncbi:hypothetical protein AVEN_226184-1 [Araneus ventricosus]|uniref:Uncharacterized protein n=1 Tax=Araneus ventricosus TaxID=182803 RepID=A0A4Y2V525_ARAVE|nr:hypothetical protein AVEN_203082-1 [Araneus ventricosus]GBO19621.1 hypothetical protein AVEN_226184-1 [Araneus ventricosus]